MRRELLNSIENGEGYHSLFVMTSLALDVMQELKSVMVIEQDDESTTSRLPYGCSKISPRYTSLDWPTLNSRNPKDWSKAADILLPQSFRRDT